MLANSRLQSFGDLSDLDFLFHCNLSPGPELILQEFILLFELPGVKEQQNEGTDLQTVQAIRCERMIKIPRQPIAILKVFKASRNRANSSRVHFCCYPPCGCS